MEGFGLGMKKGATWGEKLDQETGQPLHRYSLFRKWGPGPACMFIGLNPSTATEVHDDPTIRRCMRFAKRFKCGTLYMLNLFAYRSTEPDNLLEAEDPEGPDNMKAILSHAEMANVIVCAWGSHPTAEDQALKVLDLLKDFKLWYLEINKDGNPKHPLYISQSKKLKVFKEKGE